RRALGLAASAMNWGPWAGVGMAAALSDRDQQRRVARAIGSIEPADGLRAFGRALRSSEPLLAIAPVDWAGFVQRFSGASMPAFFSDVAAADVAPQRPAASRFEVFDLAALATLPDGRRRTA